MGVTRIAMLLAAPVIVCGTIAMGSDAPGFQADRDSAMRDGEGRHEQVGLPGRRPMGGSSEGSKVHDGKTNDDRGRFRDAVAGADTNGDGVVSRDEFMVVFVEKAGQVFARLDNNGDGVLSRDDRPRQPDGGQKGGPKVSPGSRDDQSPMTDRRPAMGDEGRPGKMRPTNEDMGDQRRP